MTKTFRGYLDSFMKILLDDFAMFSDMERAFVAAQTMFSKV
jgi:hypothetical protein